MPEPVGVATAIPAAPSAGVRRAIVVIAAALITAIAVSIPFHLAWDRDQTLDEAYTETENLAAAVAQQTFQSLAAVDHVLHDLSHNITAWDLDRIGGQLAIHRRLAELAEIMPDVIELGITDRTGRLMVTSSRVDPEDLDLATDETHRTHADRATDSLFVGRPGRGGIGDWNGAQSIVLSRRLGEPEDRFAGVIHAAVAVERFQQFYDSLRIGEKGSVGLIRADGIMLIRGPHDDRLVGVDYSKHPDFPPPEERGVTGRVRTAVSPDGVVRIGSYRLVPNYGVAAFVAVGEAERLVEWWRRAVVESVSALVLIGLVIAALLVALRALKRGDAEQAAHAAGLHALARASVELGTIRNLHLLLQRAAALARELVPSRASAVTLEPNSGHGAPIVAVSPYESDAASATSGPAVSLVGQDGRTLGRMRLVEARAGAFTGADEAMLVQLAQVVSAAVENARLLTAARRAAGLAEESRAAETAARRDAEAATAQIEQILSSISDAFFSLDRDWRFTYVNAEAERQLGRSRDELIGKYAWDEFPETRQGEVWEEFHRAMQDGTPAAFQFHFPPTDRRFDVRAFPYRDGLSVYFRDITRKVHMEAQLRQAQRMEAVGQLTGGVAHDFNNLLMVILGNIDILADELADRPEQARMAQLVRQAAIRAAELTNRLLAFSRRQPLAPQPVDVNQLLANLESLLRRSLGEHIVIRLRCGEGQWPALVDPGQLENAVLNLAVNARDAMPAGGTLTIATSNMPLAGEVAQAVGVLPGPYVRIAVTDNGTGMPPEVQTRALEPFFTTKDVGKGSGLGLSMVYGFVTQSGGQVTIDSQTGRGTTVTLFLPKADHEPTAAGRQQGDEPMPIDGHKILVVEDDPLVRDLVEATLRSLGHAVTAVGEGRGAVEALKGGLAPDLLLTDVVLPGGMNGRQVAEAARAVVPALKVLFMSGYAEDVVTHDGRLEPGMHLLPKPFRKDDLARKIVEVMGGVS